MRIHNSTKSILSHYHGNKLAILIGNFDGVHQGHQYLIEQFVIYCRSRKLTPLIITFSPHPMQFIKKISNFRLTIDEEKYRTIERLAELDIYEVPFDETIREITGVTFLDKLTTELPMIEAFYLGHDFSLGNNKEFDIDQMQKYCLGRYSVIVESPLRLENVLVSSSRIRNLLENGNIQKANDLLGYPYLLEGLVIHGNKIGTQIGFPTANLKIDEQKLIPMSGVYHVRVFHEGRSYSGLLNIGKRPTINQEGHLSLEVHILDFKSDLYNKKIKLEFISMIRDERKFESLDALRKQIKVDYESIKNTKFENRLVLIGHNIKHSRSPLIYSRLLQGFPLNYKLVDIDKKEKITYNTLINLLQENDGISITAPYKQHIKTIIDKVEFNEEFAVNAIRLNSESKIVGINTDFMACKDLIQQYTTSSHQLIFVLGDGAMAQMMVELLNQLNYQYYQFSRKLNNLGSINSELKKVEKNQVLIINCCSREFIFPDTEMTNFVFWDLNYSMPEHEYKFHIKGVNYINGLELLELQARYALSFWNLKTS